MNQETLINLRVLLSVLALLFVHSGVIAYFWGKPVLSAILFKLAGLLAFLTFVLLLVKPSRKLN